MSFSNQFQILLEEQARNRPSTVAVEDEHTSITFAELLSAVKNTTALLTSLTKKMGEETFLPVLVDRTVGSVVNLMSCLAGRVPFGLIDAKAPIARIQELRRLLGDFPLTLASSEHPVASADAEQGFLRPEFVFSESRWTSLEVDGSDPALVLTTSGSTGKPKGVVWTYDTVMARFTVAAKRIGDIDGQARIPVLAPLHFVAGFTLIVSAMHGARLTLVNPFGFSPAHVLEKIVQADPTHLNLSPQMARVFSAVVTTDQLLFPNLLSISTGADICSFEDFRGLRRVIPQTAIFSQIYGSSEAAQSFSFRAPIRDLPSEGQVPLGELTDAEDIHLEPLGNSRYELWRKGNILSHYLRNDELNEAQFITDMEGNRWWKSRDIVRQHADGAWFFDSRLDDTVKIRGMLASPSEARSLLQQHPKLSTSVVISEKTDGISRLVAHVEKIPGADVDSEELRNFLTEKLPDYLVPARFVFHDIMPVNERGKPDRVTLQTN